MRVLAASLCVISITLAATFVSAGPKGQELPQPGDSVPVPGVQSPRDALRSATQALRQGRTEQAIIELEYAAERGLPGALWKLGRMYADGDGVHMNKALAYEYFRRLTTIYADDGSGTDRYVANAFVTLGLFYLDGIPGVLEADPSRARQVFQYAASYFGNPEAQYHLGRLYRSGNGVQKDPIQAARWLDLSSERGDHRAQALLGEMLFKGDEVARHPGRGLFWLILAKDGAGADEGWITDLYSSALAQANESDRVLAHKYLEDWLKRSGGATPLAAVPLAPLMSCGNPWLQVPWRHDW